MNSVNHVVMHCRLHADMPLPSKNSKQSLQDDDRPMMTDHSMHKNHTHAASFAEPLLERFQNATHRLHEAIGRLPLMEMNVPEETCEEMGTVKASGSPFWRRRLLNLLTAGCRVLPANSWPHQQPGSWVAS